MFYATISMPTNQSPTHQETQRELVHLMDAIPGLLAVVITDRDGVPILKASKDGVPESALRPSLLSALSTTSDLQGYKLGNGKCQVVICEYQHFQVVIMNRPPFIITLVGSSTANTGRMLNLGEESFSPILEELTKIVVE